MKAAQIKNYGGPEVIEITDIDKPAIKEGQVLVEVYAASLNPFDYKVRSGAYQKFIPLALPYTPGGDFSGVIIQLGRDVLDFRVGDEVYGSANVADGASGSLAEDAAANVAQAAHKPKKTNHAEAAASVLVGISAIQALDDHLKLNKGQKILIHGGAGGIGHIAIQYAKHLGAYVATTVRRVDEDFVKALGADEVIDYQNQNFENIIKDYDGVFDTVGGNAYTKSFQVLRKGGILVSMTEQPNEELAKQYAVQAIYQSSEINNKSLGKLAELIDKSVLKVHIVKEFPLAQTAEAFKHLETGHPRGKVVIKIK